MKHGVAMTLFGVVLVLGVTKSQEGSGKSMAEFKARLQQVSEECNKKTLSNTQATMNMFYDKDNKVYRAGRCYLHCVLEKFQLVDKAGQLLVNSLKENAGNIPHDKIKNSLNEHLDKCIEGAKNRDKCNRAFEFTNCLFVNYRKSHP